jgi:hypothetical protein
MGIAGTVTQDSLTPVLKTDRVRQEWSVCFPHFLTASAVAAATEMLLAAATAGNGSHDEDDTAP